MLRRRGNGSVFCGADADFLDSDGIPAIKYRHEMEKLSEDTAPAKGPGTDQCASPGGKG